MPTLIAADPCLFRAVMARRQVPAAQLAERLGITRTQVYRLRDGARTADSYVASQIAKALHVDVALLWETHDG